MGVFGPIILGMAVAATEAYAGFIIMALMQLCPQDCCSVGRPNGRAESVSPHFDFADGNRPSSRFR
jgi:hypothetical protein